MELSIIKDKAKRDEYKIPEAFLEEIELQENKHLLKGILGYVL